MSHSDYFDLSDWSVMTITGPDRASFLHSFCTNDIKALGPGTGCEAFITSIKGRILGHVLVFAEKEQLLLVAVPGAHRTIVPHLQKYLLGVDAQVHDGTDQHHVYCLMQPLAANLIRELSSLSTGAARYCGCVIPDENWVRAAGELGLTGADAFGQPAPVTLPEVHFQHVRTGQKQDGVLACVGLLSEPAWLWIVRKTPNVSLAEPALLTGRQCGASSQFDSLRIAAGFPWHGRDITEENIAQEAGRTELAISFKKGCYLGQEPIARLDAMGHTNRELRGLLIQSSAPPQVDCPVYLNELEVGRLTSVAAAAEPGSYVALAMLKTVAGAPGTPVTVRAAGDAIPATVYSPAR